MSDDRLFGARCVPCGPALIVHALRGLFRGRTSESSKFGYNRLFILIVIHHNAHTSVWRFGERWNVLHLGRTRTRVVNCNCNKHNKYIRTINLKYQWRASSMTGGQRTFPSHLTSASLKTCHIRIAQPLSHTQANWRAFLNYFYFNKEINLKQSNIKKNTTMRRNRKVKVTDEHRFLPPHTSLHPAADHCRRFLSQPHVCVF